MIKSILTLAVTSLITLGFGPLDLRAQNVPESEPTNNTFPGQGVPVPNTSSGVSVSGSIPKDADGLNEDNFCFENNFDFQKMLITLIPNNFQGGDSIYWEIKDATETIIDSGYFDSSEVSREITTSGGKNVYVVLYGGNLDNADGNYIIKVTGPGSNDALKSRLKRTIRKLKKRVRKASRSKKRRLKKQIRRLQRRLRAL